MMHLESGIVYNIAFKLKDMLEKKIQEDLFEAMKSHDETRVSALRAVKTAIQNEKTNGKFHELTEADIVKIVQKKIKQREEAENIYREAGREELANKEQNERLVLKSYVPKMLAESEVKKIVDTQYDHAMQLLSDNRDMLEHIAKTLLEKETLDEKEFENLMNEVRERREQA